MHKLSAQEVQEFTNCCRSIVARCDMGKTRALDYAYPYAVAGVTMRNDEEIHTQALYILTNIMYWRGKEAKMVRETLKKITA